jgi:hypothetical protein
MGKLEPNNIYTTLCYIRNNPNSDVNNDTLAWMLDPLAGNIGYFAYLAQAELLRVSEGRATITEEGEKWIRKF